MTPDSVSASAAAAPKVLFVGLCRSEWVQFLSPEFVPGWVGAGGPATSAAVTFSCIGGQATLLTGVGNNGRGMHTDLQQAGVRLIDTAEHHDGQPAGLYRWFRPGDEIPVIRSGLNSSLPRLSSPPALERLVQESSGVLVDGHYPELANDTVRAARKCGRLCLLHAREWTRITPHLLPFADIAVVSTDSQPRDSRRHVPKDTLRFLLDNGPSWAVITDGIHPIRWASRSHGVQPDISVPVTQIADTMGAEDAFIGALTHAVAAQPAVDDNSFGAALQFAAQVAACSCGAFGPRAWMDYWPRRPNPEA